MLALLLDESDFLASHVCVILSFRELVGNYLLGRDPWCDTGLFLLALATLVDTQCVLIGSSAEILPHVK